MCVVPDPRPFREPGNRGRPSKPLFTFWEGSSAFFMSTEECQHLSLELILGPTAAYYCCPQPPAAKMDCSPSSHEAEISLAPSARQVFLMQQIDISCNKLLCYSFIFKFVALVNFSHFHINFSCKWHKFFWIYFYIFFSWLMYFF